MFKETTVIGLCAAAAVAIVGGVYLACNINTVQAGYVGVRVNLYADKGVQN